MVYLFHSATVSSNYECEKRMPSKTLNLSGETVWINLDTRSPSLGQLDRSASTGTQVGQEM